MSSNPPKGQQPQVMPIEVFFDGACEPQNPGGVASFGWVIRGLPGHQVLTCSGIAAEGGPKSTNNFAEYCALGKALKFLASEGPFPPHHCVIIRGDSQLVVNQLLSVWACNAANLKPLLNRCMDLLGGLGCSWTAEWIPREKNEQADRLTQDAYVRLTGRPFPMRERAAK